MKETILVADDEADIRRLLAGFLGGAGYRVLTAGDGEEALRQVERGPDLILLDVNMPGPDGFQVCRRIRDHVSCPILFLTARVEDADKIRGFAAGGDDYVVKPFSLAELRARVEAHLRREARHSFESRVRFSGELVIDFAQRCLFVGERRLNLAPKEFDILELLAENPGQIFDRERIYERVWGWDSPGDSGVVAEHIRRIRAKLSACTDKTYLETVWGCGYRWVR